MGENVQEVKIKLGEIHLPFDALRQKAILGHVLRDRVFFLQCRQKLQPEWFGDARQGKVYRAALDFYRQFDRTATKAELKSYRNLLAEEEPERSSLLSMVEVAWNAANELGLDLLRQQLTDWYHARLYREAVALSNPLFNDGKFAEAYSILDQKTKLIKGTRFDEDIELSFDDPAAFLAASEQSYKDGLTTGFGLLDQALTPDGLPHPSLYLQDTTVMLAPSNIGKTSMLVTTLVHNVLNKVPVLFLTHEGRPNDIREKILCSILRKTKPELFALYKTEEGLKLVIKMTKHLQKYLTYIPYNRAGMTVEEVVAVIRRRNEERKAKMGEGYKLLVDDYPAKLGTERAKGGNLAQRNLDAIVYDYFVQLALELNVHSLLAVQSNRKGSEDNRKSDRLLGMEDVRESWDVMTMATNVISINRDEEAAQNNRVTFFVCKSRSSRTGRAVVAKSNYGACVTHWDTYGGTWYWGDTTLSDQIDQFLKIRNGTEITAVDLHRARDSKSE